MRRFKNKKISLLLFFIMLLQIMIPQGLVLATNNFTEATSASELVNQLVGDSNITVVGTPTYNGNLSAASVFDSLDLGMQGSDEFSLPSGILVTSGDGTPPLSNTSDSYGVESGGGVDTDVATYAGVTNPQDSFSLEFDFTVPDGIPAIEIKFMFGSDEYPEYMDSEYVDGAIVLVDGINYATFSNGTPLKVVSEAEMVANSSLAIEYDGISAPKVVTGLLNQELTTHHIKIVIADTSDTSYDTGLFLALMQISNATEGGISEAPTNSAPTDITLDSTSVDENASIDTVVGSLSTTDPDTGDSHSYSLVNGTGDTDNAVFTIDGTSLKTAEVFDYETKNSYSIRIKTDDENGGTSEKTFTITVNDTNDGPTDISLDSTSVDENASIGTVVGSLSTADPDMEDSHSYSLVSGTGGTDNASFTIDGTSLKTAEVFNYESKSSYSVRIKTDDGNGGIYEKAFTITVNDTNDAPTISSSIKYGNEGTVLPINSLDFINNFSDEDHNNLSKIQIVSLPANAILKINGTPISEGTEVLAEDLETITIEPDSEWNGTTFFIWKGSDGTVYSNTAAFTVTIAMGDSTAVTTDLADVEIGYALGDNAEHVTQDIILPTSGTNGSTISWASSDLSTISVTGDVYRPDFVNGNTVVILTATATKGEESDTRDFILTVIKEDPIDEEAVATDLAQVDIGYAEGDNAGHVTQDIILPSSGSNGSTISWASNDSSKISVTGEVYRPSFTLGDVQVTVTASVNKGTVIDTKEFLLTVIKQPATDEEAVAIDTENLTIGYVEGDDAPHVTQNIILKTSGNNGTYITWTSSAPSIIAENGEVYRPTYTVGDEEVTVTASVYKGDVVDTKAFYLTVIRLPMNDGEKVAADKDNVEIGYVDGDNANSVVRNVILPTAGDNGSTITWSSSNPSVIATDGTVTRPSSGDITVKLTATITSGSESVTKEFTLVVKSQAQRDNDRNNNTDKTEEITVDVETGVGETVSTATIERTTEPDGTIKDNVTLEEDDAKETVNKLKEQGQDTARIVIPDAEDQVSEVKVNVPKESLDSLAEGNINLEIYTENGRIIIPASSLSKFNEDLYFRIVPIKDDKEKDEVIERAKKEEIVKEVVHDNSIEILGRPMTIETNMESQPVTIVLPLYDRLPDDPAEREKILDNLVIFIEHDDGTKELVKGTVTNYNDPNSMGIEFGIDKFSTFTMVYMEGWEEYLAMQNPYHEAYILGYPDGTFKPSRTITRAEVATLLARNMTDQTIKNETNFPDLSKTHWAYEYIQEAVQSGLMEGYPDGTFRPNQPVTRAEMATIAARWKQLQDQETSSFEDVTDHWAEGKIAALESSDIINGYPDGTFKPNQALNRAEAVKIFNRLLERGPLHGVNEPTWPDVPVTHWAFEEVEEASDNHHFRMEEGVEYLAE